MSNIAECEQNGRSRIENNFPYIGSTPETRAQEEKEKKRGAPIDVKSGYFNVIIFTHRHTGKHTGG